MRNCSFSHFENPYSKKGNDEGGCGLERVDSLFRTEFSYRLRFLKIRESSVSQAQQLGRLVDAGEEGREHAGLLLREVPAGDGGVAEVQEKRISFRSEEWTARVYSTLFQTTVCSLCLNGADVRSV